jgi:hypothetical protein
MAASPAAWSASMPGDMRITSPKTSTPSSMPVTGWAAVIPGSELCRGAALNELSSSHRPISPATITQ